MTITLRRQAVLQDERGDAVAYLETKKYGHDLPYRRAYERLPTDPSPMGRGQAMRALGSSHQAAAGPYLVKGLSDAAAEVRRDAAVGLQTTFGPAATDPLAQLAVSDPDDQVRIQSVRALQNSPTAPSVRALIAALDDRNAAVVYWAHLSLVRITRQEIGFDPKQWLTWYQQRYALPGTRPASAAPEKAAPPDFAPAPGAPSHAG